VKKWLTLGCVAVALVAPWAVAQQQMQKKGPMGPRQAKPVKVETLACRLGTEDEHARIAVVLHDSKVQSFAYYSKWKPRTCSMDVKRNDAFSKWEDTGSVSVIALVDDTGAVLIDHERDRYKFMFRDVDRMRYCGMEGKVSGSLTIIRGNPQCQLDGIMRRDGEPGPLDKLQESVLQQGPAETKK
jgi:hypothetical protein